MNKNIYEISEDLANIFGEIEANDGVLTDELESRLVITEQDLENKLRSYKGLLEENNRDVEYIKDKRKQLAQRIKSRESFIDRLKYNCIEAVKAFGTPGKSNWSLKYSDFTVFTKDSSYIEYDEDSVNTLLEDKNLFKNKDFVEAIDSILSCKVSIKIPISKLDYVLDFLKDNNVETDDHEYSLDKKATKLLLSNIEESDVMINKLDNKNNSIYNLENNSLIAINTINKLIVDKLSIKQNKSTTVIFK